LEEEVRIGAEGGEAAEEFGRIGLLEVGAGGRIWVLENQALELRVFGESGQHIRTIGRSGGGPGEFRRPVALLWDPRGDLWVADVGNRRYTRYDTAGQLIESRVQDSQAMVFGATPAGMTRDGKLYDSDRGAGGGTAAPRAGVPPLLAAAGMGTSGDLVMRAMFDVDGGGDVLDTVRLPQQRTNLEPYVARVANGMSFVGVPFAPRLHTVFDDRGYLWFGESDEYRIYQRRFSGDTVLAIEREYQRLPARSEEIDAWVNSPALSRFKEAGGEIDRSRIPAHKPVFNQLLLDDTGHLWVRLVRDDSVATYDIFDATGRYLGAVDAGERVATFPPPVIRGNRFYAVVRDSLDVPEIVRYLIRGRN
jgi:hypothetical protein